MMTNKKIVSILFLMTLLAPLTARADKVPAADKATAVEGTTARDEQRLAPLQVALQSEQGSLPAAAADDVAPKEGAASDASVKETAEEPIDEETVADPLEPWNRAMFTFNDKLYFWALKPAARGYSAVVAEPVRVGVRNMFTNAVMPIRFVNSLLQGKIVAAGTELARFGLNTTLGLAGFIDVAQDNFNLLGQKEDLGQTLGYWGIGHGVYLVWPFLGPSSLRDTVGLAGDSFLTPVNYLNPFELVMGIRVYDRVNRTSLEIGDYEDLIESSLEPYTSVKDAYFQHRNSLLRR